MRDAVQASGWVWRGIVVWDKDRGLPAMGRFARSQFGPVCLLRTPPSLLGRPLAAEYDSQYASDMERVTATLDVETLAKIRRVAGPRGVSSFLNEAARERLARLELRGLLDDLDAKHGPVPVEVRSEVARAAKRLFRAK
jgi:hypothetical protein